jgi:RNA polymerase sigma-70 factor (ECF subfamily)
MTDRMPRRFSDLFAHHAAELRAFLRNRRGVKDAEDLVQESFVRLMQTGASEAPQNSRAWLYRTCANLASDAYDYQQVRRRAHTEGVNLDTLPDEPGDPARLVSTRQELQCVWSALMELPEPCRHAFLLNRLDGMSQRHVAAHLGISEKTVERYVLRALTACRAALSDRSPD